ncbi:hypothetical protein [Paenibacillus campi]|uniref:hypothetical protein n=1 Tax=Paenibacillus campi TaxID=3106031 RepID=UPI002AFF7F9E|nr:hypothetical protein [Paenibacillus sp. SGZ-1014]
MRTVIRTMLHWFALRNLLLICCAVLLVLLMLKGSGIYHKVQAVKAADRNYEQQHWMQAEALYRAANDITAVNYEQDHIRSRLNELEPITAWNNTISSTASRLQAAADTGQFDTYLNIYAIWLQQQEQQTTRHDRFQSVYAQITQQYGMEQLLARGFAAFRTEFTAALQHNLDTRNYTDESAKWNLLRIPATYWLTSGSAGNNSLAAKQQRQQNELRQQFQQYDTTKLKRLAAAGDFDAFLSNAVATAQAYSQHAYTGASWIASLVNTGSQAIIAKDIQTAQTANFVRHAVSFRSAATQLALSASPVLNTIDQQIATLQEQAFALTSSKQFSQALQLYETLTPLGDMAANIARTKLAWASDQPVYVLQSSNASVTYEHTVGGTNWQAFPVYAIATDNSNRLFFGRMDRDGTASVWSGQIGQNSSQIGQLSLDMTLSTAEQPVVAVQSGMDAAAGSNSNSLFSLYAFTASGLKAIASLPGSSYEVLPDHSIIVHTAPDGSGAGQLNTYIANADGVYVQTESRADDSAYTPIAATDIEAYVNEPIQFTSDIVAVDDEGAIVRTDRGYVRLRGNLSFYTGTVNIYGTFHGQYEQFSPAALGLPPLTSSTNPDANSNPNDSATTDETTGTNGTPNEQFEPQYGLGNNGLPGDRPAVSERIPIVEVQQLQ